MTTRRWSSRRGGGSGAAENDDVAGNDGVAAVFGGAGTAGGDGVADVLDEACRTGEHGEVRTAFLIVRAGARRAIAVSPSIDIRVHAFPKVVVSYYRG